MVGIYTVANKLHEALHERIAWLVALERQQLHWRQLSFDTYDDYLASIDSLGEAKQMVALHETTQKRKGDSELQIQGAWRGLPELTEFAVMEDGEGRWRHLAALAQATTGAPDPAKHCLNITHIARLHEKRRTKGAMKDFINELSVT